LFALGLSGIALLSGCSSIVNTAGKGDFSCPGMPTGVTCKTPAAVYKSTHGSITETEFDEPIVGLSSKPDAKKASAAPAPTGNSMAKPLANVRATVATAGPKPVREPAQVVRIWIAPWVDKQDNLHLAQTLYAEVKPRTWTVGKSESLTASGYVIPHQAFDAIGAKEEKNERTEKRPSDGDTSANSQAVKDANSMTEPAN
jgi:conjugal transfer pilus assembly protein TraV